ncbi:hypothetical protein N5079_19890 [Planotetraspora sp. A-T 1434]|uniref:hypothetical protein n=1 Tax=Planotetraspora sp. A-T 1434 TaxID=2979219 RepID=UPI0021C248F1|nr:hypothetical protein [Planotetraspora sp. A-T 1434]MCT9932467.1 hypothetical protein [Planotetraspora sp. A-T 1434]
MGKGRYVVVNEYAMPDGRYRTKASAKDLARRIEKKGGKAEVVQPPPCPTCGKRAWPCC